MRLVSTRWLDWPFLRFVTDLLDEIVRISVRMRVPKVGRLPESGERHRRKARPAQEARTRLQGQNAQLDRGVPTSGFADLKFESAFGFGRRR